MKLSKLRLGALAVILALFFGFAGAAVEAGIQGHMLNARSDLNSALNELYSATADKGGHRANAINLVRNAIREVNLGIQYAQ